MSVVLIRPKTPETSHSGIVSIQYPINIGYLVSYLKKNFINCFVRDFEVENFSEVDFIKFIRETHPAMVGFSCMTPHILHAAQLASVVKANFPEIKTVVGGVHPSAIPEQTLKEFPQFDIVVVGEGEQTLLELSQRLLASGDISTVQGIVFRNGSEIKANPRRPLIDNIDEISFPDRALLNLDYYKKSHVSKGFSRKVMRIAEIMSARGCPYDCIFCASGVVHSRRVRFRSYLNIIAEIEGLIKNFKIQHLSFLDDTFTIKQEILEPVCNYIKVRKITFDCFTRVNDIDEKKMKLLVASGCKKISFGVESGSQKVLDLLKKKITVAQIRDAFRISRKFGLPIVEATFMLAGHPEETEEDIELTKRLIFQLRPDILALLIAIPYPGTELNRILKERGFLLKENWQEFKLFFTNPSWKCSCVPNERLRKILRDITFGYYSRPDILIRNLLKIRNFQELKYWINLAIYFIKSRFIFDLKK